MKIGDPISYYEITKNKIGGLRTGIYRGAVKRRRKEMIKVRHGSGRDFIDVLIYPKQVKKWK